MEVLLAFQHIPFLPKGEETTVDDCVEVFEYVIKLVGENNVE